MKLSLSILPAAFAGLVALSLTPRARAQSITNGDFVTDLSGWTTQGPSTIWVGDNGPDNVSGAAWINDVLNATPFLQQTITGLTSGQNYTISGFYGSRDQFFGTGSFTAQIDGTTDFVNTDMGNTDWKPFAFTFTAASASAVLRFNAQVGNDSDYRVDKIAITPAAVPEPGSIALVVGFLAVGGVFARRRVRK